MIKVIRGYQTIPFDTKEEWEDFWRNLCISDYPFLHAQDSWNTYNTALQEIKMERKKPIGCGLYFHKWQYQVKDLKVNTMDLGVLLMLEHI